MHHATQPIPQGALDLYDDYAHQIIDRRQFMERLAAFAVGSWTVATLSNCLMPNYAVAATVVPDDPRIITERISYASPQGGGTISGLLARPAKGKRRLPAVLVVHENRGLYPYIEDVARRTALAGYCALAPDALSPLGGYPGNDDEGRTLQQQRDQQEMLHDFIAGGQYLLDRKDTTDKLGVVGFCFGGWISNMMAVRMGTKLSAAVPYYGRQPTDEEAAEIKAPLLLHYAELDERVNAGWPAFETALKANQIKYEAHFYLGANHGFHNNSTPRFDAENAELSWQRTLDFFGRELVRADASSF